LKLPCEALGHQVSLRSAAWPPPTATNPAPLTLRRALPPASWEPFTYQVSAGWAEASCLMSSVRGRAAVAVTGQLKAAPVTFPGGHDGFLGGE